MGGFYRTSKNRRFLVSRKSKGFSRKSEAGLTAILVLVIAVFFFGWLINVSQRECKSNKECGSEAYCGSDFSCHTYPTIQKTVIQYNLFWPSLIIGVAIVIAAVIFRWATIVTKEKSEEEYAANTNVRVPEEATESYYKSNNNIKTP